MTSTNLLFSITIPPPVKSMPFFSTTQVTLLDNHAPIRTKTIRQSPFQRHQLSKKTIKARRFRRKMEKIYFKTLHIDDKSAYDEAKNKA